MNPTFQQDDGTWWCVWSGYTFGPFDTESDALDEYERIYDKMNCKSGGCDS